MKALVNGMWNLKIWKETRGQDLVELALMGGFVALAGAAVFPSIGDGVAVVFNKVLATLALFGGTAVGPSN
jgi:Flp pilus assembly pilin Flp